MLLLGVWCVMSDVFDAKIVILCGLWKNGQFIISLHGKISSKILIYIGYSDIFYLTLVKN